MVQRPTAFVRFEHGLESCLVGDLQAVLGLTSRLTRGQSDAPLEVLIRTLGLAITSVNDTWGVFSRSRIALLPHQLWVCRKVLSDWPTRWLVADDVGLGKTIEAGLILTPLLASGQVQRLLILAPASLVGQWAERLKEMFDIRVQTYSKDADKPRLDYWNSVHMVVASAHTLRLDHGGRWERLLAADPWDMVLVDEAHHLHAPERGGTLAYRLVRRLQEQRRVKSMVFFTGTPHRGNDTAFLNLLGLLRPDLFDAKEPIDKQLSSLRTAMIRNNKQMVTDMKGDRLFTPVRSHFESYSYSPSEAKFYAKLTEFIASGKMYASTLSQAKGNAVQLVLVSMQKLASSSVAAVERAIRGRLGRLQQRELSARRTMEELSRLQDEGNLDPHAEDLRAQLMERLPEDAAALALIPMEIPTLTELLTYAEAVNKETKIQRILEVIDEKFPDESVLFFTEYKATQALLFSALEEKYGRDCTTFINGDGRLVDVNSRGGANIDGDRNTASKLFRKGKVRFLVSTEAAGEGVDLQDRCSSLIHVDLPWNPMRLHQRVGRVSRYGQRHPVDVVTIRNPDTIESRIWELLDDKLALITRAFRSAMDDPEDMRQLVLGMASPAMFEELFSEAEGLQGESLEKWFDRKTKTLGGRDAVSAVREIFGNVAKFDFGSISPLLPRVDLPDLLPFFKAALAFLGRRPDVADDGSLSFRTPRVWQNADIAVAERYEGLLFAREEPGGPGDERDIAGVGHRVVNAALRSAEHLDAAFAVLPDLDSPVALFLVRDQVTDAATSIRRVLVGAKGRPGEFALLKDWEVIRLVNGLAERPRSPILAKPSPVSTPVEHLDSHMAAARDWVGTEMKQLALPFRVPVLEDAGLWWTESIPS